MIITSDHGEEFGEHLYFGHAYNTNLDAIGVPLVILSPRAPRAGWCPAPSACATCRRPWSTCWASRPARRSRAARWRPAGRRDPGRPRRATSPALSEQAEAAAFQARPRPGREHPGFQMSLVASGHHYIRHGMGLEQLYDLRVDPDERVNLMASPTGGSGWEPSEGCSSRC